MISDAWKRTALMQASLLTRRQLAEAGVSRSAIAHRVARGRWQLLAPTVVCTTTGELTRQQLMWLGLLHAGPAAILGELTAAEEWGLRRWHRDDITVLVPHDHRRPSPLAGITFRKSRRELVTLTRRHHGLPLCRLEPAVLIWAARQESRRVAEGVVAAAVQQRLASPGNLLAWLDRLHPLRGAGRLRVALADIEGGAHSTGELDVRRMCKRFGLRLPHRQVRRRDSTGRLRFTDCEWRLPDGRILVLEVDGAFHMDADSWEDDLARQRALSATDRLVVHCTTRELRDQPEIVAYDLRRIGVPAA